MKRMKKVLILLLIVLLTSGCSMKMEYNMAIQSDKSMDFSVIYVMDDDMITSLLKDDENVDSSSEITYSDRQKWDFVEKMLLENDEDIIHAGFIRERYETEGYKGYRFTKKIKDIESVTGSSANFNLIDFYEIETTKLFTKKDNHYQLNMNITDEKDIEEGIDYKETVDAKFTIMLPEKAISNNATEVSEDGKILTWDLNRVDNINLEFEIPSNNTMMYIVIGAIVVILLLLILMFIHNKKKSNNYKAPQPKEESDNFGAYTNSMNQTTSVEPPISMGNGQGMTPLTDNFTNNQDFNNGINPMMNNTPDSSKNPVLIQDQMPSTDNTQNMTVASTFGSTSMMANTNQQDTNAFRFIGGEETPNDNQPTNQAPNPVTPSFAETKELPQDAMKTKVCPNCGAKLAGDATVCFLCGRKI